MSPPFILTHILYVRMQHKAIVYRECEFAQGESGRTILTVGGRGYGEVTELLALHPLFSS